MTEKEYADLYRLLKKFAEEAKANNLAPLAHDCVLLAQSVQVSFDELGGDAPIWAYKSSGVGRKAVYADIETKVLALHYEGLSLRKIAKQCGCSTRPVRDIIARSQGRLPVPPVTDEEMSQLEEWAQSKMAPKKRNIARMPKKSTVTEQK